MFVTRPVVADHLRAVGDFGLQQQDDIKIDFDIPAMDSDLGILFDAVKEDTKQSPEPPGKNSHLPDFSPPLVKAPNSQVKILTCPTSLFLL